jgi:hypothetical protein
MPNLSPDSPEFAAKAAKAWLVLSPFGTALAYGLAAIQGADTRTCLIIAGAMLLLCLFFSGLYYLRGSKATGDLGWINMILRLIARR